eukprot:Seg2564.6 transcript_id=Seg2564.6/GoldUCD/mRNA.D3Y31 product="GDP-D-glucose phosphorylase 1" protein_id=Seg2564.6/GoldUCD/D3Y31
MENGCFWYDLKDIKIRKLAGNIGFIAQLNAKRFKERRKPDDISYVQQPFRSDKFNFTKVKKGETLFLVDRSTDNSKENVTRKENAVIINVSPIDKKHVLLVPDISSLHPQRMNFDAVKLSIEICLVSRDRGLRIGFNSLCAFASVNHLHLHILHIDHQLPIDNVDVLYNGHGLFELVNYSVRGFALQLEDNDIDQLSRRVDFVTSYLYENDIAHNLFLSRHDRFMILNKTESSKMKGSTIRVFIFPKLPAPAISEFSFNSAALEIAGFLPIRDETQFQSLNETEAVTILNRYCYQEDEFSDLRDKIIYSLKYSGF